MTKRLHLSPRHREEIEVLLHKYLPDVEVWAYGSRVNGQSHDGSDLDLVLRGPKLAEIDTLRLADFIEALQDSTIPFLVEARDWARLPESFHREIDRDHVVLAAADVKLFSGGNSGGAGETIADFVDIVMGQSPPGDTVSGGVGIPLLNGPTEFGPHHPTPVQFTTDARKIAHPGDLLFCVRGSTTGRMNWADQKYAIGRGVAAIRHRCASELQPFVRAIIEFELPELLVQATGSTFPNVSASQLSSISYPNLSAAVQRAIAHILGTLDDKIELNRRMNGTLEAMARALFKSWLVDFDPVRAKMAGRDTSLPSHLADLFPDRLVDSELGEIPEGWKVKALEEFGDVITGKTPSTRIPEFYGDDVPFLKIPDMHGQMYVVETSAMLSSVGAFSQALKTLPSGSISVSCIATPGLVVLNHRNIQTNQQINSIIPRDRSLSKYLYWSCKHLSADIKTGGLGGSVFGNMNKSIFSALPVLNPEFAAIRAFDQFVSPIHAAILANEEQSQTLAEGRDSLLPKLISGELRTQVAESIVAIS